MPGVEGRPARESYTWPLAAIVAVIVPQVLVPVRDRVGPPLAVPIIEGVVVLVMLGIAARPGPVPRTARPTILALLGALIAANAAAAGRLVALVLDGGKVNGVPLTAGRLLVSGALVLAANVVTFAVLYWQLDLGGPAGRAGRPNRYPDFQFPQTTTQGLAAPTWQPRFSDYLYVAYTNIVAFSPTDTMPLTSRAKALMTLQSLVSVAVLVVVVSRVINILPSS
ncbi:MAG TPA: hypothetical protein VH373_11290 [Jatrophihabitantaceae bacterium]